MLLPNFEKSALNELHFQGPKFQSILLYSHFWVTGHFETKWSKWLQNDLEHRGQRYPIMNDKYPTSHFAPRAKSFLSYRPFWVVHRMIQIEPLNTKRSKVSHTGFTSTPPPHPRPKFQSVLLYGQPFSSYKSFWDKSTKWPKVTLKK